MASKKTKHYQLNQWEPDDAVLRNDFNADNLKLDAALAEKAERSALTALSQTVAAKGNCSIETGSYIGTGQSGQANPCLLRFTGKPMIVFLGTDHMFDYNSIPEYYILFRGAPYLHARSTQGGLPLTWMENSVSWYSNDRYRGPEAQFNLDGVEYQYIALVI